MSYIYVGSPYSGSPEQMEHRFRQTLHYTTALLKQRKWAYSPIVHCHEMAKIYKLPTDMGYWAEYNFAMMKAAYEFHVLQLEGWKDSQGLQIETAYWRGLQRPGPILIAWK
jgi:Domain of unknown function (DUF1937)